MISHIRKTVTVLLSNLEVRQSILVLFLFLYCLVNICINVLSGYSGFDFNAYNKNTDFFLIH